MVGGTETQYIMHVCVMCMMYACMYMYILCLLGFMYRCMYDL